MVSVRRPVERMMEILADRLFRAQWTGFVPDFCQVDFFTFYSKVFLDSSNELIKHLLASSILGRPIICGIKELNGLLELKVSCLICR